MGKIKKILDSDLVGGAQQTEVYPITAFQAVYNTRNKRLDGFLNRNSIVNISSEYSSNNEVDTLTLETAISKVPVEDRVIGFTGKFLSEDGWQIIRFNGATLDEWSVSSNWDRIDDLPSNIKAEVGSVNMLSDWKTAFNGTSSYISIPAISLQLDGDYIEMVVKVISKTNKRGGFSFSGYGTNTTSIGLSTKAGLSLRDSSGNWVISANNLPIPSTEFKLKISINSTNLLVHINDSLVKTVSKPSNSIIINRFGNSYQHYGYWEGYVGKLSYKSGSVEKTYDNLYLMENSKSKDLFIARDKFYLTDEQSLGVEYGNRAGMYLSLMGGTAVNINNNIATTLPYGITFPNSIDLNTEGDYFEIRFLDRSEVPQSSLNTTTIYGELTNGGLCAGHKFYFRSNSSQGSDYRIWDIPDIKLDSMNTYKLLHTREGWELFVNGKSYGTKEISTNAIITGLCNNELSNTINVSVEYVSFHSAISGDGTWNPFAMSANSNPTNQYLIDLSSIYSSIDELNKSLTGINSIFKEQYYSRYTPSDGIVSYTKLSTPVTLQSEGDFVELYCRVHRFNSYKDAMNLLSNNLPTGRFGFHSQTGFWFRPVSTYVKWDITESMFEWNKIKLLLTNTGWELFINDVSKGVQPLTSLNESFSIYWIGATNDSPTLVGMDSQRVDIKYVKFHTSTSDLEISPLFNYGGSSNVQAMQENDGGSGAVVNPLCFVTYNKEKNYIRTYVRDRNIQSRYYMFNIYLNSSRNTKDDPISYRHFWELDSNSRVCTYSNGIMSEGLQLIAAGESECVLMYTDSNGTKVDFTGGVHGDESIDIDPSCFVKFYVNGVKLSDIELSNSFELLPCSEFSYIQRSMLHDTAIYTLNKDTGVTTDGDGNLSLSEDNTFVIDGVDTNIKAYSQNTIMSPDSLSSITLSKSEGGTWVLSKIIELIPEHPIIATHIKKTVFKNQGYSTENSLLFKTNREVNLWYHGICCMSKNFASVGHNEDYEDMEFTGTENSGLLKKEGYRMFEAYNPTNGSSSHITARITDDGGFISDKECVMFIWDRANDSKYYRKVPTFIPEVDKKITSVMEVSFNMK